jgi:hypothetical protein
MISFVKRLQALVRCLRDYSCKRLPNDQNQPDPFQAAFCGLEQASSQ